MKNFRKIIFVLLFVVMAIFVSSCDNTDESDKIAVNNVKQTLTISGKNNVTEDLDLPTSVGDVKITWSSDKPDVVANDGTVNRPVGDDVKVKLTATITLNDAEETSVIEVTVIGIRAEIWDVTFDLGYRTDEVISAQEVTDGQKAEIPTEPTRDRYEFVGWFEEDLTTEFDFDGGIEEDTVIYAKWLQTQALVIFETGIGNETEEQIVNIGEKAVKPDDLTRERFEFVGWYFANQEFDFDTEINSDMIISARWNQIVAWVTFDVNYTGGTSPKKQEIDIPGKAVEPVEPEREDFFFLGWYDGEVKFDFDNDVESDINLVARWGEEMDIDDDDVVLVVPTVLTHYIGSEFNPLSDEVYAFHKTQDIQLDVIVNEKTSFYNLDFQSDNYHIDYEVAQAPNVKFRMTLIVRRFDTTIPEELTTDPIEITLWHSNGSVIETALEGYATEFEDMMTALGYNITVNIEKPASTYDDLRTDFINAIKGAELPNLVQNYPDHVVEYDSNGVILPLTPYIFHPTHGMGDEPNESIYDILPAYRAENRSNNLIGDYLSLPFNKSTEVATYNKTFFDAVLKGDPMPETWQDLFALFDDIMAIKDAQIDAIAARWQLANKALTAQEIQKAKDEFVPITYDSSANAFITLTRQFGGQYTSKDPNTGKGQVEFINDRTISMLNYFATEGNGIFTLPPFWGAGYANEVSFKGTTIFSVGSTGGARYNTPVETGVELYEIGMMPVPYDKFNPLSRQVIQQGTNISLTTAGDDHQKLASWLFLKYLTSTEVQADFGITTGYSPVRNSSYETPAFQAYLEQADVDMAKTANAAGMSNAEYIKAYEDKVKAMASKAAAEQREYAFYDEAFIGSSKAREEVGIAIERILLYTGNDLAGEIQRALNAAKEETERVIK